MSNTGSRYGQEVVNPLLWSIFEASRVRAC